ncbi:MAG: M48 family metallopeptidase [Dehalococcoidia bacterium]|nr:M48 family metallopeptidase [Dehalococcoidia bacterium]
MRIEIRNGTGLAVVIPRNCKMKLVDEMLAAKTRWILDKYDTYVRALQSSQEGELEFGGTVPYLGRDLRLVSWWGIGTAGRIEVRENALLVGLESGEDGLASLVEGWYRGQAASLLERKADEFARAFGVTYTRFSIRGQRTRWGSCSHRGTLSFNWRLIMAPEPVVDYVVIHEVAHLREMNHTKRFWELVAVQCPSWREHKKWLDEHGTELAAALGSQR